MRPINVHVTTFDSCLLASVAILVLQETAGYCCCYVGGGPRSGKREELWMHACVCVNAWVGVYGCAYVPVCVEENENENEKRKRMRKTFEPRIRYTHDQTAPISLNISYELFSIPKTQPPQRISKSSQPSLCPNPHRRAVVNSVIESL